MAAASSFSGMVDVALERDPEAPAAPDPERVASREWGPAEKDGTRENAGPSSPGFAGRAREDDASAIATRTRTAARVTPRRSPAKCNGHDVSNDGNIWQW